jgi:hypothetical protein
MFNWFKRSSKSGAAASSASRIEPRPAPVLPPPGATVAGSASPGEAQALAGLPASMRKLSLEAQQILVLLPPGISLAESCATCPHAVERLLSQWRKPVEFHRVLDSLLIDLRGGRQGFSFEIVSEFSALGEYYDLNVGHEKADAWASSHAR